MEYYGDRYYKGLDLDALGVDEFYLNLYSPNGEPFTLYSSHKECSECPYIRSNHGNSSYEGLVQKTYRNFRIAFSTDEYLYENSEYHCDLNYDFAEFGIYNATVERDDCFINTAKEPVNIYYPMLTVAGIYVLVFGLVAIASYVFNVYKNAEKENGNGAKKERVLSIDTFRGISIAIMIFINFGAGGYQFFDHAAWNGLHMADLAFPWFMWIMGFCIPISLSSSFKKDLPNSQMLWNILKRSIKLFAVGIFLGSGTRLSEMRIFGVLQRFGIAYFVISLICIYCMDRNLNDAKPGFFSDVKKLLKGWFVICLITAVYIVLLVFVTKDGCPRFYLGPGGLHKNMSHEHCIGGATGYIDELILGPHMYQYPTISEVYESKAFDPEGILGCLTTFLHVFLGVQAGTTLLVYKKHYERLLRWFVWAVITGVVGGFLCGWSKEDGLIPVNKNLWSISFVMVTSCFALVVLSVCYILIDVKKWWSGKPLLFAGMNAILMYIGHSMTGGNFPVRWELDSGRQTHFLALLYDVWGAAFWIFISYYLYKIKYFFVI